MTNTTVRFWKLKGKLCSDLFFPFKVLLCPRSLRMQGKCSSKSFCDHRLWHSYFSSVVVSPHCWLDLEWLLNTSQCVYEGFPRRIQLKKTYIPQCRWHCSWLRFWVEYKEGYTTSSIYLSVLPDYEYSMFRHFTFLNLGFCILFLDRANMTYLPW